MAQRWSRLHGWSSPLAARAAAADADNRLVVAGSGRVVLARKWIQAIGGVDRFAGLETLRCSIRRFIGEGPLNELDGLRGPFHARLPEFGISL
jgi:hypothetical protein